MTDENVQAQIARAQETANQAFDLAKAGSIEIASVKERVGEVAQRLAFQEKVILNHADSLKSNTEAVTQIQIGNAGISNEVKNMGLTSNRIEASVAQFKLSVEKGFGEIRTDVDTLTNIKNTALGSWKTWAIIGGVLLILVQIILPLVMARIITPPAAVEYHQPASTSR